MLHLGYVELLINAFGVNGERSEYSDAFIQAGDRVQLVEEANKAGKRQGHYVRVGMYCKDIISEGQ